MKKFTFELVKFIEKKHPDCVSKNKQRLHEIIPNAKIDMLSVRYFKFKCETCCVEISVQARIDPQTEELIFSETTSI